MSSRAKINERNSYYNLVHPRKIQRFQGNRQDDHLENIRMKHTCKQTAQTGVVAISIRLLGISRTWDRGGNQTNSLLTLLTCKSIFKLTLQRPSDSLWYFRENALTQKLLQITPRLRLAKLPQLTGENIEPVFSPEDYFFFSLIVPTNLTLTSWWE